MGEAPNTEQAERWNGESGRHWIAHRERHLAGHRRLIPHLFRAVNISVGDRVLDVGCGCGETTIEAARLAAGLPAQLVVVGMTAPQLGAGVPAGQHTAEPPAGSNQAPGGGAHPGGGALGLDLSGPMLDVARRLAAEAAEANVGFERGDAQVYPLPRGFYDVVISSFGVMFFDDPVAAFTNIAAAVRPGGRLAFLCWQDDLRNELFGIPLRAFAAHIPPTSQASGTASQATGPASQATGPASQATGPPTGQASNPLTRPPGDDLFADPRRVRGLLSEAGWTRIRIQAVNEPAWMGMSVADVVDYIRGMRKIRTLIAELNDQTQTDEALAAMAKEYSARQRPDGIWVGAAAWLVSACRG